VPEHRTRRGEHDWILRLIKLVDDAVHRFGNLIRGEPTL
jgi:hypothetical protein